MNRATSTRYVKDSTTMRTLLPIVALGGGLAATPAAALELGELTVHSYLGQPLRASIAYALAPNEVLSDSCVSIGRSTSGLPGIARSTIKVTERAIVITGGASVYEPMLGTRITINCPYTPNLSREYMLLVDPANTPQARKSHAEVALTRAVPKTAPVSSNQTPAEIRNDQMAPIGPSSRYQTKVGESLSGIVSRIENRSMKLWPAVNAVFEANPDAFIDNDPNKLKAGSWLTIPSLDGTVPVVAEAAPEPVVVAPVQDTPAATSAAENVADDVGVSTPYEPSLAATVPEMPAEEPVATNSTSDLRPGDVILGSDDLFIEPASSVVIPDTELAGPETTSTSPNVPTAVITTGSRDESTSLLVWLIGGGLAIIAGLVLFGRRVRSRFGFAPVDPVVRPSAEPVAADIELLEAAAKLDYDLADDSPTEENLALDVDLEIGTGLDAGTQMDVAETLESASTTELDFELPFEPQADKSDETDVIPAMRPKTDSILESEILPDDDDYDVSVIMDATKMPHPEDVTERDLMAVKVSSDEESSITDNYTISQEIDFDILEQDYEDELTATQALNEEIERAAAALVEDLNETGSDEETSVSQLATVTTLDVTAQLQQQDDATADMDAEGGKVDTRAS